MVKPSPALYKLSGGGSLTYTNRQKDRLQEAEVSRCCQQTTSDAPNVCHSYIHVQHRDTREMQAWFQSLPKKQREIIEGRLEALIDDAECGGLSPLAPGEPIKTIDLHHDLFELRLELTTADSQEKKLFRMYHGEPQEEGHEDLIIVSHAHFKSVAENLTNKEIKSLQDAAIDQANMRYTSGKPSEWGLPATGVVHPLDVILPDE